MAALLTAAFVPAAFAADTMTQAELETAINQADPGDTVEVTGDVTLNSPISIDKALTLDGNGYTLTATYTDDAVLKTTTAALVTIQNLTIDSTQAAFDLVHAQAHVIFKDSTLMAQARGIRYMQSGDSTSSELILDNTKVLNNGKPADASYDTWTDHNQTRGISLWGMNDATITVKNGSEILGYSYAFNMVGDTNSDGVRDYHDSTINVIDSTIKGWTAFNVWCANSTINITNSYLKGINNSNGLSDGFATIVVNDDIYGNGWGRAAANKFNIKGGTITSYRSGLATEQLFRIDNEGVTKVNFTGSSRVKTKFIDGTGDSASVFYSGYGALDDTDWETFLADNVTDEEKYGILNGYNGAEMSWIPVNIG